MRATLVVTLHKAFPVGIIRAVAVAACHPILAKGSRILGIRNAIPSVSFHIFHMTEAATAPSQFTKNLTPGPALSKLKVRRASSPYAFEYSPMLNIKTCACPKCRHTFLRYANSCPECGFVTRRKKRSRTRSQALLGTILAIVTTCFFVSEIPAVETVFLNSGMNQSLGGAPAKPASHKIEGTDRTRRILIHEADLEKMRTSSTFQAQ
jgi:hypothetical protein